MGSAQEPRLHRAKPLHVGKEYLQANRGLNDSQLPFCPTRLTDSQNSGSTAGCALQSGHRQCQVM